MDALAALARWIPGGSLHPADDGLINRTWLVRAPARPERTAAVLQWVNPIFSTAVALDIQAVTAWLADKGMPTTRLRTTVDDRLWVDDTDGGHWRMLTYVPGRTLHRMTGPELAFQAGELVGRFHTAMADFPGPFQAPARNIHDTQARMADLRAALEQADGHPLEGPARQLGADILAAWEGWGGTLDLRERPCHGDLKLSNLRFEEHADVGVGLIDLDTLGPLPFAVELGDAWRSWCNPAGENDPDAVRFDLDVFTASFEGWRSTGPQLDAAEADSLVPGIERICLELSARFAADAVLNSYFREDRSSWPQVGHHNLVRARAQLALARQARLNAPACRAVLDRHTTQQ